MNEIYRHATVRQGMDSGNLAERPGAAMLIEERLNVDGFYSPTSRGTPWDWAHMGTYDA